ncbi:hypothetical protein T439DRAFT_329355 [Meredithblackwellia eburnea MCA 4105]
MRPSLPVLRSTSRSSSIPKRFQTGLYDARTRQTGSAVGETFSNKTRRTWLPNVQTKKVWSEALGRDLKLTVTAGTLRTIDKCGGVDSYLFRMGRERVGQLGLDLRELIKHAHKEAKFERQATARLAREEQAQL